MGQFKPEEFDYLNSNISVPFNEKISVRSTEMFELEVRERARLLYNLKFKQDQTIARLKHNISWEFDDAWTTGDHPLLARIDDMVATVYKRMKGKRD